MTYIVTQFGQTFTSTGFFKLVQARLRQSRDPALQPARSTQGHQQATRESGATPLQGRAVTGYKTAHYAESADREGLAATAMANLNQNFAKFPSQIIEN